MYKLSGCYRPGSLSQASAVSLHIKLSQQLGLSHHLARAKMLGARGGITAFARPLVSAPCEALSGVPAVFALAPGCPLPDIPGLHPVCV